VFLAIFGLRFSGPFAASRVHPGWAANIVAVGGVFLIAYIVLRIIGGIMTSTVRGSPGIGPADRVLGLGFGVVRGVVMVGLVMMVLATAFPGDRMPHAVTAAKLYPIARAAATTLQAVAPRISPFAAHMQPAEASDAPPSGGGQSFESGYSAAARKGLDEAVEKSR